MTDIGTESISRLRAREILLGDRFAPRRMDIETPQLLLDAGIPPDVLRLVSFSAEEGLALRTASKDDKTGLLSTALSVVKALRWREDDEPVFAPTDAPTLCSRDLDLLNTLGLLVNPFISGRSGQAIADAKNASLPGLKGDGLPSGTGIASPDTSASPPQESASEPSMTATS